MMERRPVTGDDGELLQADLAVDHANYASYTEHQVTLFEVPFLQLVAAFFRFHQPRFWAL